MTVPSYPQRGVSRDERRPEAAAEIASGGGGRLQIWKEMNGRTESRKSQRECDSDGEIKKSGGRMNGKGEKTGWARKEGERGGVREEGTHDFVLTSKI